MDAKRTSYMLDAKKKSIMRSIKPTKMHVVLNSTEKFLKTSLKTASTMTTTTFTFLQKLYTKAPPPPSRDDLDFMTYIIRVDKNQKDYYKSILTALKKTTEVREFRTEAGGRRVIVSAKADLKLFLKGLAKVPNARLDYMQSGQCSSNLDLPPHVAVNLGHGNNMYGGSYYGNGGGYYGHGGYHQGGQQMGYYGYNNNYYGQTFMDDDMMMKKCPCEF